MTKEQIYREALQQIASGEVAPEYTSARVLGLVTIARDALARARTAAEPSADPKRDALLQIKDFALGVGPDYYVIAGIVNRVLGISDGAGCTCDRGPCSIHRAHENRRAE